jgi:dimethylaniline monooxygenase (N-oxide forming)
MPAMNGIENKKKRVCVIGAGCSGLTAIRQLRDEGLDVVCYERSDAIGGLWYYQDDVRDGIASVARSTIINTSKEFSAYSDFPPPDHFPNFMHNSYMVSVSDVSLIISLVSCSHFCLQLRYFQLYAEHNCLEEHILLKRKVILLTYADDYETTGRWKVTTESTETGEQSTDVFEGVVIATGHHVTPLLPNFPGQEKFQGKILHTHTFKHATGYEGKRVCVIGVGNSGGDAIVELSVQSKVVYMSTRRGAWIRPRVGHKGYPMDNFMANRIVNWGLGLLPKGWGDAIFESYINLRMDHQLYGLKPAHRVFQQHPLINDSLNNVILAGRVQVRPNVKEFTENGVIFEGDTEVTEVDAVVFATGYKMELPFVDKSIIAPSNNEVSLYKNMFSSDLLHPHTLALVGLVQPLGPIHTTSEMQSRWFAALMSGKVRLPSKDEMKAVIAREKAFYREQFYESPRHSLEIFYIPYLEEIARTLGCMPNLWQYALTDPKLWYHLVFGLYTTYQFRLVGDHRWPGARDAIIHTNDRIEAALKSSISSKDPYCHSTKAAVMNGNTHLHEE